MSDEKRMDTALLAENDENTAAEENALVLKLSKPYVFDGQTFTEVDLSGLEDATGADLIAVERSLKKRGIVDPLMEMSSPLAAAMASRMTGKPEEFYTGLPIRDMVRVKTAVSGFLYGGGED